MLAGTGKVSLAGSYGCEVSSEGPSFLTIYGEANMSVAIPPKEPPTLHGLRPSYEAGETLYTECTSAPSYPPALLAFILNGKEVSGLFYENGRLLAPGETFPCTRFLFNIPDPFALIARRIFNGDGEESFFFLFSFFPEIYLYSRSVINNAIR